MNSFWCATSEEVSVDNIVPIALFKSRIWKEMNIALVKKFLIIWFNKIPYFFMRASVFVWLTCTRVYNCFESGILYSVKHYSLLELYKNVSRRALSICKEESAYDAAADKLFSAFIIGILNASKNFELIFIVPYTEAWFWTNCFISSSISILASFQKISCICITFH